MRKKPSQQRSQDTVAALVEATAQVIAERGLAAATTNHIAARAGVSVGSLYQYFDSKETLIHALLDRISGEMTRLVDERMDTLLRADARTATRGLLTAIFDFIERNEGCYLELVRHWQQLRTQRTILALERHMLDACRQYLLRHHGEFRADNLPAALFVVISSAIYTSVHYLSQPRPYVRRDEVIGALSDMIASYFESGPAPKTKAIRRQR